jgi:hypothetical protein
MPCPDDFYAHFLKKPGILNNIFYTSPYNNKLSTLVGGKQNEHKTFTFIWIGYLH